MENYLRIKVNFVNEAEAAGIWILPQTEDNMKTTVWGGGNDRETACR